MMDKFNEHGRLAEGPQLPERPWVGLAEVLEQSGEYPFKEEELVT